MRVLDLTGGRFQDQFDGKDVLHTEPDGQPYDVVATANELSTQRADKVRPHMAWLVEQLAVGGELHLLEPSAEWVAREIEAGRLDIAFMIHVFGHDERWNHSLFTLPMLRDLCHQNNLIPFPALTRAYVIAETDTGERLEGDQHYVVATKLGEKVSKAWMPD